MAERAFNKGEGLKSMVYGGLDGAITTFAVVAGATGGELDMRVIIILGFANLLADGISMAVGDYLSSKSEKEYDENNRKKQQALSSSPQGLAQVYQDNGMQAEDAKKVADILSKYDQDTHDELIGFNSEPESHPLYNALITFFSFAIFGLVPLLVFIASYFNPGLIPYAFPVSITLTFVTLFILGTVKAFVTDGHVVKSGMEMLIIGGLAAVAAYGIGFFLGGI